MRHGKWSRRDVLWASAASAAGVLFAEPLRAAAPPPTAVTPALIEAARKEGKVSFYTALELTTAERLARVFEAKYPGIAVRVERSGAERIFQRIAQEQGSGIRAVDVANSTDPAHYLDWKKNDWLAPYLTGDVARYFPADQVDPDGMYATACGWIEAIGYNASEPRLDSSFYDLLASEARLASFVLIAQGKVGQEHWFALGRLLTTTGGAPTLLSWSGSMFEYLMPLLIMPTYDATLLDQTYRAAVRRQIAYGKQRCVPWGISESGYNTIDAHMNYQYRAFGVPGLGLKRGLAEDLVIAPYASVLALTDSREQPTEGL